jgi:hypothetical protein
MAMEVFLMPNVVSPNPPTILPIVVTAIYEVDRVNRRIVIAMYPDLPS